MSNLQSSASEAQLIDLFQNFKMPIMGAGGGFAPIGTINFFDASVAPQGWLACDGQTYNITDYPELATYYASVHGSSNFYGGNGTTTFAVPDLRGEFLRGTGTNSHTNQGSGANVGVHQDGTEHTDVYRYQSSIGIYTKDTTSETLSNPDHSQNGVNYVTVSGTSGSKSATGRGVYTSRPTNTSFLICVKATVAGDPEGHVYNYDETIYGTSEDGEIIYERTHNVNVTTSSTWTSTGINATGMKRIVYAEANDTSSYGTYIGTILANIDSGVVKVSSPTQGMNFTKLTLRYIKTS